MSNKIFYIKNGSIDSTNISRKEFLRFLSLPKTKQAAEIKTMTMVHAFSMGGTHKFSTGVKKARIKDEGKKEGEIAPYVVLNYYEWMKTAKSLPEISGIRGYGYYGSPSITAVTPFKKVCFAVFALQKNHNEQDCEIVIDLNIPNAISFSRN